MSSSSISSPSAAVTGDILSAARITVIFCMLYAFTFVNVLVSKRRQLKLARQAKKDFDRYNCPQMRTADRLQANYLEWSPMFLGLVWSLAATGNFKSSSLSYLAAWAYIGLRLLYIVLILTHGVQSDGMNRSLWISTFPAYGCLMCMALQAVWVLFF